MLYSSHQPHSISTGSIDAASSTKTPNKRCNWTKVEDVLLLSQVWVDMPFLSRRGAVIESWEVLAAKLQAEESFARAAFERKKAQNRFLALLEKHHALNAKSADLSGVSESYSERHDLLDDVFALFDDSDAKKANHSEKDKKKREEEERKGTITRETAMVSLRKQGARPIVGDRVEKKSLQFQQQIDEHEREREVYRKEREVDREERFLLARMELEKTMVMLQSLVSKKEQVERAIE
ncbi:hypothetical protein PybrP1_006484 [[Pythium] brassicae (nom. inval.)]|nr:hypothetical protein PybrP1_006484 [[Pythium] brassicae (nom. inval.)]